MSEIQWDYSEQKGMPGHCFAAQVWDSKGESLAVLDSTIDPAVATATAKLMAASPEMLYCLQRLLPMVNDYNFRCSTEGKVLSDRINALLAKLDCFPISTKPHNATECHAK